MQDARPGCKRCGTTPCECDDPRLNKHRQPLVYGEIRTKAGEDELSMGDNPNQRTPMDYDDHERESQCGPRFHESQRPEDMRGGSDEDAEDEPEYWSETEQDQSEDDEEDEDYQELARWAARPYRSVIPAEQARDALDAMARASISRNRMNGTTTEL